MQTTDFNFETKRKTFHVSSLVFPILYLNIQTKYMIAILFLTSIITLYMDISRHYNSQIKDFVNKFLKSFMRKSEESGSFKLSGASFMIVGFLFSAIFFSKGLAITSWLILIISDPLAALVGIKIGKKLSNGKSIEGAIAFLVSSIFISMLCYYFVRYNTGFSVIIISCIITTAIEFFSQKVNIDDNLSIPLVYCFSTELFRFIL